MTRIDELLCSLRFARLMHPPSDLCAVFERALKQCRDFQVSRVDQNMLLKMLKQEIGG
jgi:hypothetical protein